MGNKSAWETLAISKDKQIVALTAELEQVKKERDAWKEQRDAEQEAWTFANARAERAIEGLRWIVALEPRAYAMPSDWSEQIAACAECERYKDHPIQRGICDKHRRPLWDREKHDAAEARAIGPRAQRIASDLLRDLDAEEKE